MMKYNLSHSLSLSSFLFASSSFSFIETRISRSAMEITCVSFSTKSAFAFTCASFSFAVESDSTGAFPGSTCTLASVSPEAPEPTALAEGLDKSSALEVTVTLVEELRKLSTSRFRTSISDSISHRLLLWFVHSFNDASSFERKSRHSSRAWFLSFRTLLHFSRQLAVQSDHHLMVFSICATLARTSSSSRSRISSFNSISASPECRWEGGRGGGSRRFGVLEKFWLNDLSGVDGWRGNPPNPDNSEWGGIGGGFIFSNLEKKFTYVTK